MRNKLDRRRAQIDPKTLRKHSSIVARDTDDLKVVGDRIQTDFGFIITGYVGKFETQFMCIMPAAATPTWEHPKKARVYRVNSGLGYYMSWDENGVATSRQIVAGDEVATAPGQKHKLGTTGQAKLELFITQESKYEAHLVEVEATTAVDVPAELLAAINASDRVTFTTTRRSSKAAEQIAAQRGQPVREKRGQDPESFFRNGTAGLNAMPLSNFNDDGAG